MEPLGMAFIVHAVTDGKNDTMNDPNHKEGKLVGFPNPVLEWGENLPKSSSRLQPVVDCEAGLLFIIKKWF